jgi:ABC-2 type transport system permease protein
MTTSTMTGPSAISTAPSTPARAGRHILTDAATMVGRGLRLVRRDPDELILSLVLPIMIMLMFVYVFGGAMDVGTAYVTYATPGVILLCAGYGASNTAITVSRDMTGGIIDRFRSMPISGWTVLLGHIVASVVKNLVTTAIVLGVAALIGFRPNATLLEWLAAVGIIAAYVFAITCVATFLGVLVRSPQAAGGFGFAMLFLPYVSSAFVPPGTMPAWLQGFADHQPVTPVIETVRGLLVGLDSTGAPVSDVAGTAALALAWCAGIALVSLWAAVAVFVRKRRA